MTVTEAIARLVRTFLPGRKSLRASARIRRAAGPALALLLVGSGPLRAESLWSKLGVTTAAGAKSSATALRRWYTPPQAPGESNHFLDLWPGPRTADLMRHCGLTNNHALIVNSHGCAVSTRGGSRYRYYPHEAMLAPGQKMPYFSVEDLARVVGLENTAQIHNIVIAGCNDSGSFDAQELRIWFINATNITHMAQGERGYQPMFLQALTLPSSEVEPLYETVIQGVSGRPEYEIGRDPMPGSIRFSPYVAELFLPGAKTPFRTRVAGRELLDPALASRAQRAAEVSATPFTTAQLSPGQPR